MKLNRSNKLLIFSVSLIFILLGYGIIIHDEGEPANLDELSTNPCEGVESGVEHGGYLYDVIAVGDDCWFAEDLRYECDNLNNMNHWDGDSCAYQDEDYGAVFYQWEAAMDGSSEEASQGLCPDGWYIPTDEDWINLERSMSVEGDWHEEGLRGESAGDKLKGALYNCNEEHCNQLEFNALPSGHISDSGLESVVGRKSYWWTSSQSQEGDYVWDRNISEDYSTVGRYLRNPDFGYSIRCIRDK